jgi:TOTE conflict system primase-like protein
MDHASGAVAPSDAEVVQVGDAIRQRAERRGLVQRAVRPVRVAEVLVLAQDGHQVALVPDQGPVQQLPPAAADPALHDRVHSRRLNTGADDPGASGPQDGVERGGEAGVPVMQDELHAHPCIVQVHQQVPALLHYPRLNRMLGGTQDPDQAGTVLDDGQDVDLRAIEEIGGEEVKRQDPLRLGPQELRPARAARRGTGLMPASLRICSDTARVIIRKISFNPQAEDHPTPWQTPGPAVSGQRSAVSGASGQVAQVFGTHTHEKRDYLPLTMDVLAAHLRGDVHVGVYPLLDGDRCWWLAADFDGPDALADALMYGKAARALQVPVALEVSRSGVGAHAWVFFTSPVPAEMARRLGTGLLREAMAMRGRMKLDSYDRLFPSQDLLPADGIGNLTAAPLFRPARRNGATVFLNLEGPRAAQGPVAVPVDARADDAAGSEARCRPGPGGSRSPGM